MSTPHGLLALVLHAHLPYVRHPERQQALEERWLFEAITECYLPLVDLLLRLFEEGVPCRLAVSVSPTLAAMLRDPLLGERYRCHLDELGRLLDAEAERDARDPWIAPLLGFYRDRIARACQLWEAVEGDLVAALAALEDTGLVELLTTAATHAYLPLIRPRALAAAQVAVGLEHHERLFGRRPKGFWLPECGYEPGLEDVVGALGPRYVVVDAHGLLNGDPAPRFGVHAPALCPGGAVACFARDPECSKQVWSATEGYPADPVYREFFRDLATQRTAEELGEYFAPFAPFAQRGDRGWPPTGIKLHRITGPTEDKELYDPAAAAARALEHGRDFLRRRREQAERVRGGGGGPAMDRPPLVVAPFDAELFGHWWFEGPAFLEAVIRGAAAGREGIELVTPSEVLERWPRAQVVRPSASSWGDGGYSGVWLSEDNAWVHRYLAAVGRRAVDAVARLGAPSCPRGGLARRALEQALRELLLAQASDWPFLIRAGTARDYAERRLREHCRRAWDLLEALEADRVDEGALALAELERPLFSGVDLVASVYSVVGASGGRGAGRQEARC